MGNVVRLLCLERTLKIEKVLHAHQRIIKFNHSEPITDPPVGVMVFSEFLGGNFFLCQLIVILLSLVRSDSGRCRKSEEE